ncbi:MAG: ABC-F family ATP-binding cassette domain-containing protein [Bacteroidota bacterium]
MHYLSAEGLSKSYGIQPLFQGLSFHIQQGNKIALVARNGSGKSTLLKILAGQETPDSGKCWVHKDVQVILFEQEPLFQESATILDNIFAYKHPVIDVIKRYEAACESSDTNALTDAISEMDELGAWDFDAKVKQILGKLNIHHLDQTVLSLSGGQRKRVALARTLIDITFGPPDILLIMDEPTNHLDVEMVEWLEQFLNRDRATLLLVTHDRYFLDSVCNEVWELDGSNLYTYTGDYENYLEKKAARLESDTATIDKARNQYRSELEWMRKQPKARTTKSKSRQDNFYKIEEQAKRKIGDEQVVLEVKMNRLGGKVLELKKVYKRYGDRVLLKGFDYTFKRGERIGVIGKNGVGKSTFLNLIQGLEEADSGKINVGETVVFGNYSQQGLVMDEQLRVIEFVKNIAENFPLASGGTLSAAQFLQRFLFDPEKQYTYIHKLSGGEKRRLHLLSILFKNPNFLILDEPTNDLDLPTLSVLEEFLMEYPGCLLIVSHDRYFMDRLVYHLFVFEGDGVILDFPGNYAQYRLSEKNAEKSIRPKDQENREEKIEVIENVGRAESVEKKKPLSYKEKREFETLEKEIPQLQEEKLRLTEQMSSGELPYAELEKLTQRFTEINRLLEVKEWRWLELSEMTS